MNFLQFNGIGDVLSDVREEDVFFVLTKTGYETLLEGIPTDLGELANELLQIKSNSNALGVLVQENTESIEDVKETDLTDLMNRVSALESNSNTTNIITDVITNEKSYDITLDQLLNIVVQSTTGSESLKLEGSVYDPTNVSTGDSNLIDGDTGDLIYNNSSTGSANKELPAINLGSSKSISYVRIWWWRNAYVATNWKLQGSNDGTTWVDIETNIDATGKERDFQDIQVNDSYQYVRVFCVTGANSTYVVISEMEVYSNSVAGSVKELIEQSELIVTERNNNLYINNPTTKDYNITIYYKNK